MLAPVLIRYGNQAQKRRWLPRILDGSDWWCQGYSEPGAGSDLASLKTTAVREGDHYIVNGRKWAHRTSCQLSAFDRERARRHWLGAERNAFLQSRQ
jgi:hypothetical protein